MLERNPGEVAHERSSRKEPLSDKEVAGLIAGAETVLVAKGRKVREMAASEATLDDLKGPTGGYRAPMIVTGRSLLVGFNPEALRKLLA